MHRLPFVLAIAGILFVCGFALRRPVDAQQKPPITLDEFFNSVDFTAVRISPDGGAVVIATERADWDANRYRDDLWLYRVGVGDGALVPLTQSGHDRSPQWSPDSHWIAFLSDRPAEKSRGGGNDEDEPESSEKSEPPEHLYVISTSGGEAFPASDGDESVHSFAWSADSRSIFFATKHPQSKEEKAGQKKEWKDVIRFRESERGDEIFRVDVAAVESAWMKGAPAGDLAPATHEIAAISERVAQLDLSPNGERLAFFTEPRSEREESIDPYSIYAIELKSAGAGPPRLMSHTAALYEHIRWAKDDRHIFFSYLYGSVEGAYQDAQQRVYWVDAGSAGEGHAESVPAAHARWAADFGGAILDFAVLSTGDLFAAGQLGTEVQAYTQSGPGQNFSKRAGWPGVYEKLSAAAHSSRVAFVYSALDRPSEVYLAESAAEIAKARPLTSFNRLFIERALPQGKPYRWTADDGTSVEGMLVYPPGKMGAKNLPTFTFIHGGPEESDANYFEADWYKWGALAATNGWLVFEPNYRGSVGYGDAFALGIIPHIVSRPGKDILEGVDALVKEGIADPNHLALGGYSYGGYMTNWLITQTTRFKAAVTGAGGVENVINWGNDDTTMDDAYFLGGKPWEAKANYEAEAAIWQIDKVTTPTLVVGGEDDIRVYIGEQYLLERALFTRGIPTSLLIFPGEGHSLEKNPWHGKIKVREELKWIEKYALH